MTYSSGRLDDTNGTGYSPDFADIGEQALRFNATKDITGFLVCTPTWYCQSIEGPEPTVELLLKKIRGDKRHFDFLVIRQERGADRLFPEWNMAWRHRTINNRIHFLDSGLIQDEPPRVVQCEGVLKLMCTLAADTSPH